MTIPLVWWSESKRGLIVAHFYGGCYSVVRVRNQGVDDVGEELSALPDDAEGLTKFTPPEPRLPLDPEIRAMQAVHQALTGLNTPARARLLTWILARYGEQEKA